MTIRVLFICLGNICRSPMAEGVFQKLVDDAGLDSEIVVDSAGTSSWHVGERAHPGTRRVLEKNGIRYNGRARKINRSDLNQSNSYLIVMDKENERTVRSLAKDQERVFRLLEFSHQSAIENVPDPYYRGKFDMVYELVEDGCRGLLKAIREWEGL